MPQSSNRLIGIDVAYTVALIGCVIYGFTFTIGDLVLSSLTHTKFGFILDCFPALFFFLNGFTVTLTMRDRRISSRKLLAYSGKRGSVLLITGLIFCAIWPMNLLLASGLMIMITPFVAQWNNILIRVIMLLSVVFGITMLYLDVPTSAIYMVPSLEGGEIYNGMGFLLFNGYFSPLPWMIFFFAGLIFGRSEIRPKGWLPPSSIIGFVMIIASYWINKFVQILDTDALLLRRFDIRIFNIRLLFPAFCVYGVGVCLIVMNAFIYFFRNLTNTAFLRFVQTISSMKYSVILFYTIIGTVTILATNIEFFSKSVSLALYVLVASGLTFYLPFLWRKKVSEKGPMEFIIKRISGSAKK
jgi:hypothetical protein